MPSCLLCLYTIKKRCTEECAYAPYFPNNTEGKAKLGAIKATFGLDVLKAIVKAASKSGSPGCAGIAIETVTYVAQCRVNNPTWGIQAEVARLTEENRQLRAAKELLMKVVLKLLSGAGMSEADAIAACTMMLLSIAARSET